MSQLVHDINGCCAILNIHIDVLQKILPEFIREYKLAKERLLLESSFTADQLESLLSLVNDMGVEIKELKTLVAKIQS